MTKRAVPVCAQNINIQGWGNALKSHFMVWFVSCSLHNRIWEGLTMVCSKNCKISSSECPRKQGDTNRSDFSFATLRKHGEKGVSLLPLNRYFSIEFCQNFYMCICRKGETFTVSIFENIGHQILKLLPKNCGNRSDLSASSIAQAKRT